MYICICNGVTEKQVRDAVMKHGAKRVGHIKKQLGACNQCGKCVGATQQILDDCLNPPRERTGVLGLQASTALQCG